jgi:tRNA dimethylallyltransferase
MKPLARLVVILGPTASGKSALGIWLAERLSGEILVCDSTQVYRQFEIGTAKVPRAERHGIPHHLIDLVDPDEIFTAGEYRRRALEVLEDVKRRGPLPILTAGTGLYLRALLEGLADAPSRSEELRTRLRERAERRGGTYLHRLLGRLDTETAARIAPRDTQKVIRALEIRLVAGKPVGEIHRSGRKGLEGYVIHKIGLAPRREQLYVRTDRRVEAMLEAGWLEEVKTLLARGVAATAKPFEFIGYAELREHLDGRVSRAEAIKRIQQATRRYAKRQMTWFRREPGVEWFAGFGDAPEIREAVLAYLAKCGAG